MAGSLFDLEFGGDGSGTGVAAAVGLPPPAAAPVVVGNSASTPKPPPKADATGTKTLVTGLLDALKRAQEEARVKGAIEYEDTYNILLDPVLENAKVVPPGNPDLRNVPMGANATAKEKLDQNTQAVDKNARKIPITAGMSIVQFLDIVTRNTSYIYEQQTKYYDPKTKELKDNPNPADVVGWYRIGMQAVPKLDKYDRKRNDYAYDITYRVEVYAINDARSDFFPSAKYRGTHKRYDYWFTGLNTQILDYQQDFNYLYFMVQNSNTPPRTATTNWREVPRYYFQPRSEQTDQLNSGAVGEPSAQLADYLYSPGDTGKIKLRIIGDPAWIQQGDVRGGLPRGRQLYDAFLPDGTINYAGQEILFEVLWNKPVDYDLSTGLMDPGVNNYGADRTAGRAGDAIQTNVYRATQCTSRFSGGVFTQELEGAQVRFQLPQARPAQQGRPVPTTPAATANPATPARTTARVNTRPGTNAGIIAETGLAGSSLAAEGFDDAALGLAPTITTTPTGSTTPDQTAAETARLAQQNQAPTSFSQTVGPAAAAQPAIRTLGGASGRDVGSLPATTLYLDDGSPVTVRSQAQINALRQGGFATAQAASAASARLNQAQQAATNPTTAANRQVMAKDN